MVSYKAFKLVSDLQERGCDVLLTGGAPVEFWSGETFKTGDWDIVAGPGGDYEEITEALRDLGYERKGRRWYRVREGNLLPGNPGEFIRTKYPWWKTHTLVFKDLFEIEAVAPEWLFVDRVDKAYAGDPRYAEQALFIHDKFADEDWDEELVKKIAESRGVSEEELDLDRIEDIASGR